MIIHIVKKGDSLRSIAEKYGVSPTALARLNGSGGEILAIGMAVIVPSENTLYTVSRGDSLYSVAMSCGCTVGELLSLNPGLRQPYNLSPGEALIAPPIASKEELEVHAFCKQDFREPSLDSWGENLTYLSISSPSLHLNAEDFLSEPTALINKAKRLNIAPLLCIEPPKNGSSAREEVERLLLNPPLSVSYLSDIGRQLKTNGYMGLNLNLPTLSPYLSEKYSAFIKALEEELSRHGLILFETNPQGFLGHGENAPQKKIILSSARAPEMGVPMAVTPITELEKELRAAGKIIERRRIFMYCPDFGYDWILPSRQDGSLRRLSAIAAQNLAKSVGSGIEYNLSSDAPYFGYRDASGREHAVWFEDARSLTAKLKLASSMELGGISLGSLTSTPNTTKYIISSLFGVKKLL